MSAFAYKTLWGCLSGPLLAFESYRGLLLLSLAVRCGGSCFCVDFPALPAWLVLDVLDQCLFAPAVMVTRLLYLAGACSW
jgi:hypothetical protein